MSPTPVRAKVTPVKRCRSSAVQHLLGALLRSAPVQGCQGLLLLG
jgi:hypothetical protein